MNDTHAMRPDHEALFQLASGQHGYFTAQQALSCGFRSNLLAHHVRSGRFQHVAPALYRLRDYPPSPYDDIAAAWLAVGKDTAVVSHESALELLDLSNVAPDAVHLTVPRNRRYRSSQPHVVVHTTIRPPEQSDTLVRHGIRITAPARSILDAAEAGSAPEQIEMAIFQGLERGLLDRDELCSGVRSRSRRVQRLIRKALREEIG